MPIWKALFRLATEGLVKVLNGRGFSVCHPTLI